ncbi:MAG: hypothetical protein AB8G96_12170 [Phycisphaerales bacterium]
MTTPPQPSRVGRQRQRTFAAASACSLIALAGAALTARGWWTGHDPSREIPTNAMVSVPPIDAAAPETRIRAVRAYDAPPTLIDVIVRASDRDWRVRTGAFTELRRRYPSAPHVPMRDEHMAEREARLYAWLDGDASPIRIEGRDRHRPSEVRVDSETHAVSDLSIRLCDLHAGRPHTEFAATLIGRCTPCHAPAVTSIDADHPWPSNGCQSCHADIVSQHAASAHAQSTSHLHLVTVDPLTRSPGWWDFGDRRGLQCTACHEPAAKPPEDAILRADARQANPTCIATFRTTDCMDCHAQAARDWQTWRARPRPRRLIWPSGAVAPSGQPAASCTDCHAIDGDHRFAARRDPRRLRAAIDVRLRATADGGTSLVVANLSGHALPVEGVRRAIDIEITDAHGARLAAFRLARPRPGRSEPTLAEPLHPGEIRTIELSSRPDRVPAHVEAIFVRDRFNEGSFRTPMHASRRLAPVKPAASSSPASRAPEASGRAGRNDAP